MNEQGMKSLSMKVNKLIDELLPVDINKSDCINTLVDKELGIVYSHLVIDPHRDAIVSEFNKAILMTPDLPLNRVYLSKPDADKIIGMFFMTITRLNIRPTYGLMVCILSQCMNPVHLLIMLYTLRMRSRTEVLTLEDGIRYLNLPRMYKPDSYARLYKSAQFESKNYFFTEYSYKVGFANGSN